MPRYCLWHPNLKNWLELGETVRSPWYLYLLFHEDVYASSDLSRIIAKWPKTEKIGGPTYKVWRKRSDQRPEERECKLACRKSEGWYWNGGSFLNADGMLLQLAKWQAVPGADKKLEERISKEFEVDYTMHETLCWGGTEADGRTPIVVGSSRAGQFGYARGVALLTQPIRHGAIAEAEDESDELSSRQRAV